MKRENRTKFNRIRKYIKNIITLTMFISGTTLIFTSIIDNFKYYYIIGIILLIIAGVIFIYNKPKEMAKAISQYIKSPFKPQ
ncbi:MAG: hypothetical protein KJ623_04820 [Nanoarchaeota archaeon]|nr:hypothetical protein [Nanoarchaeota archaeon]MBU0962682.1 hypothetical protein [Nanoarchaeota archaeon]